MHSALLKCLLLLIVTLWAQSMRQYPDNKPYMQALLHLIPGLPHWSRIPDHSVPLHDIQVRSGLTLEQCQEECLAISNQCLSVDYSHDGSCTCYLNDASPLAELIVDHNLDVYMYCEMRTTNGEVFTWTISHCEIKCWPQLEWDVKFICDYVVYIWY